VLGEFKTHNDKSFAKLLSDGVMSAKWEHFVQMQQYMGYYKLNWSLYMATNKNNDEIHAEVIAFDPAQYERYRSRSVTVIEAREPPARINASPGWYECKFCDHHPVCHGDALPARNCRTCANSVPVAGGAWICSLNDAQLSKEQQFAGCEKYAQHPGIKAK
jgi:hypothetical protein